MTQRRPNPTYMGLDGVNRPMKDVLNDKELYNKYYKYLDHVDFTEVGLVPRDDKGKEYIKQLKAIDDERSKQLEAEEEEIFARSEREMIKPLKDLGYSEDLPLYEKVKIIGKLFSGRSKRNDFDE